MTIPNPDQSLPSFWICACINFILIQSLREYSRTLVVHIYFLLISPQYLNWNTLNRVKERRRCIWGPQSSVVWMKLVTFCHRKMLRWGPEAETQPGWDASPSQDHLFSCHQKKDVKLSEFKGHVDLSWSSPKHFIKAPYVFWLLDRVHYWKKVDSSSNTRQDYRE